MKLVGNVLYGQSGGPTSVINASAYGIIKQALLHEETIKKVYCCHHGIDGILKEDLIDISSKDNLSQLELLPHTPGAAFGSVRHKLKDIKEDATEYQRILEVFKKYNIRFFFYNGGIDSMDTCNKISLFLKSASYECNVIGVPKTIDNDLPITDHTPGFGSAAKFISTSISEIGCDASAYDQGRINIVEIMGRNAGWLAASSKLACLSGYGPDLIYLPEVPFSKEKFIEDVKKIYAKQNRCLVAVSEGIKNKDGNYISDTGTLDAFGHKQMGGVASYLVSLFSETKLKTRAIELSLLQRSANHLSSKRDIDEAIEVGKRSLEAAISGHNGKMIIIKRISSKPYGISYEEVDLSLVANVEKIIPSDMIVKEGNNVNQKFIDYALPLIKGENNAVFIDGIIQFAKFK